jgi:hypothetical protein
MAQVCIQTTHVLLPDDEITAIELQLEEISVHESKGKHPVENLPDTKLACNSFQSEILAHLSFLKDL